MLAKPAGSATRIGIPQLYRTISCSHVYPVRITIDDCSVAPTGIPVTRRSERTKLQPGIQQQIHRLRPDGRCRCHAVGLARALRRMHIPRRGRAVDLRPVMIRQIIVHRPTHMIKQDVLHQIFHTRTDMTQLGPSRMTRARHMRQDGTVAGGMNRAYLTVVAPAIEHAPATFHALDQIHPCPWTCIMVTRYCPVRMSDMGNHPTR